VPKSCRFLVAVLWFQPRDYSVPSPGARWRWSVAHLGQICSISGYIFFFAGQALHTSGTIAVDCDGAIALGGNVAGCFEGSGASWLVPRRCISAALLIIFWFDACGLCFVMCEMISGGTGYMFSDCLC